MGDGELFEIELEPEMWNMKGTIFVVYALMLLYTILAPIGITYFKMTHCFYGRYLKVMNEPEVKNTESAEEDYVDDEPPTTCAELTKL